MSREEIEQLWDECRDGTLSGEDRRRFDECMLDDREMASLWGAESRWLSQLATTPVKADRADGPSFTDVVLDQWEQQRNRTITRQMRWRSAVFAGGWAALLAIAATIMWINLPGSTEQASSQHITSRRHAAYPIMPTEAVSVLINDLNNQFDAAPGALYDAIESGPQIFSIRNALDALAYQPARENFYPDYDRFSMDEQYYAPPVLLRGPEQR